MRTKAILILTLFFLTLLIPASSNDNQTDHDAPGDKSESTSASTLTPMTRAEINNTQSETIPATTSPGSSSPSMVTSDFTTKEQHDHRDRHDQHSTSAPPKTTSSTPSSKSYKLTIFLILLAIIVLMVVVGCIHAMWRKSNQDSAAPRPLLVGLRDRLRATIGNLEDRLGVRLWPGGKTEGDDDEDDDDDDDEEEAEGRRGEEGGQSSDDGGEVDKRGEGNKEKEEDSDSSSDSSSTEGDNQMERKPSRQEEKERKQSESEDDDETSSESEGGQSAGEGESGRDKRGGSEEIALVNSPQENDEEVDLCDVTVL